MTALMCWAGPVGWGQRADKKGKEAARKLPPVQWVDVYLGASGLKSGAMRKPVFDSLIRQGITAREADGRKLRIEGFQFSYAERGLFEDSTGNLITVTDYIGEYCFGDTLSSTIKEGLPERTKAGDTAFIDNIRVVMANGSKAQGRPLKIVLTK
jgi:hypothetical protein